MALCRWSSSSWYIYDVGQYKLEVCGFGQFTVVDILRNYSHIEFEAKTEGYRIIERMELRSYLKLWAYWRMKKISYKFYVKGLNFLRGLRQLQYYVQNPYEYKPFLGSVGNIPSCVQIEKVLCNKALEKSEAKIEERRKIKESPLMKIMSEKDD